MERVAGRPHDRGQKMAAHYISAAGSIRAMAVTGHIS
jgi:hypothetical protein